MGVYITALVLKVLSMILLVVWVLPVMYEESKVGNGLGWLRKVLLIIGLIFLFTTGFRTFFIYQEFNGLPTFGLKPLLIMVNSFSDLLVAILFFLIYHKRNKK